MVKRTRQEYFDRMYEVRLSGGRSNHPTWGQFAEAVMALNGKGPDYTGINSVAAISSHLDAATLRVVISQTVDKISDVTIEEMTTETLLGDHRYLVELFLDYFKPYKSYRHIDADRLIED